MSLFHSHTSELTDLSTDVLPLVVLTTIRDKVNTPSPDDPFNPEIAAELKDDKAKFLTTAKEWTKKCVIHGSVVESEKSLTYPPRYTN